MAHEIGYFGPESVTWRLQSDPVQWVGGIRALFLLALHPLALAGVERYSTFRDDPVGRLQRTGEYLGTVAYGTKSDAQRAAARVRRLHGKVRGIDPESGLAYHGSNPELLLWVHCGAIDSFLAVGRRAGMTVTAGEADDYIAEQVRSAELVGIPKELVPRSVYELQEYFDRVRPDLRASAAAKSTAKFVLLPPKLPTILKLRAPARMAWGSAAALAFMSLPSWAKQLYGLPNIPAADLGATLMLRGMRLASKVLPTSLRETPQFRQAKERVAQ
jgi:uncharacterized protein (DUF2236 family)